MNHTDKLKVKVYHTALYLRLSRDDREDGTFGSKKTESNSISSQRELLKAYVESHNDLQIFDIYIDDGWSGVTFKRPEFLRMMQDIKAGKIQCVITKDLSRFGRDYITAGSYLQKIFPALGIRFIAVTDHYDSLTSDMTESALLLPVKNFVNDSYCRDISMKVKSHQKVKRIEGKCISAFPVYGYLKDPKNKNKLIIDEYAADIVKKIYTWKIEGMSLFGIAQKLNTLYILSPMEYKHFLGMNYHTGFEGISKSKWSAVAVKRILTNEVYIGNLVQGKQEKVNYKLNKRIEKSKSDWICVKNTHDAIISEADFDIVQQLLKFDGRVSNHTKVANLFCGILICGDCNTPMIKRVNKYKERRQTFYICQTKNKSLGCSRHSIKEEQLKKIVLSEIRKYITLMLEYNAIMETVKDLDVNYRHVKEYAAQILKLQEEYQKHYKVKASLYDDLQEGLLTKEEFEEYHLMYTQECEELEAAIAAQKQLIKKMFKYGVAAGTQLEKMKRSLCIEELNRKLLTATVSHIYIYEDKKIVIDFRFCNILDKQQVNQT